LLEHSGQGGVVGSAIPDIENDFAHK
jgi:hypothetical protein